MKRRFIPLVIALLLLLSYTLVITLVNLRPDFIRFQKTYGGMGFDEAWSVVQTPDGGYAIVGQTDSFGAGERDFWLVKVDANGNALWNKTFGGKDVDIAYSIALIDDGGYALVGDTSSFGAGSFDFWLVKTDSTGNIQWNKTYGGKRTDGANSVVQTSDGGYAIAGHTSSFGAGDWDFWLVRTDANGTGLWSKTFGTPKTDYAYSIVQTIDRGYAIAGYTSSFGAGRYDFWLVKTDENGTIQWNQTYGGKNSEWAFSIVQTTDEGYAMAGYTSSFGAGQMDFWLVKTDASGNMQWNKTYGGPDWDWGTSIIQTDNEGYAIAGWTKSFGTGDSDFWLLKTDENGNAQWNRTYGGAGWDESNSVVQTSDGGYALVGHMHSKTGSTDFFIVKTDDNGTVP